MKILLKIWEDHQEVILIWAACVAGIVGVFWVIFL